jgi:radical SAM superfamily enzyme YgiQ (UPF0313 family)
MTDVLLIQPPIRDFYLTAKRTVPYGLGCLAASLEAHGLRPAILDATASPKQRRLAWPAALAHLQPWYGRADISPFALFHEFRHFGTSFAHLGRLARISGAPLVGIASLFTAYADEALETAAAVKTAHPGCRIVMGGHHATVLPEAVMAHPAVDFVLRGEAEESLPLLARRLQAGQRLETVPGIVLRRGDGSLQVTAPVWIADLDRLPPPALAHMPMRAYRRAGRGAAVVVGSRGCPLHCSYCSVGGSSGIPYRRRRVESVLAEIARAVEEIDAGFIDFEDENLSLSRSWLIELLEGLGERFGDRGLELRAMNGLLPTTLDDELVARMARSGFRTLNLSLGSACPQQLKRFGRPDVRPAFSAALAMAQRHGLAAVGYIIVGAPDQDPGRSVDDLLFLAGQRVLAGVSIYYPAPGSPDWGRLAQLGLLPAEIGRLRATALPVAHTTSRSEAVTLLRLGRILNFIKALLDEGGGMPPPAPVDGPLASAARREIGMRLLQGFLHDGTIHGMTPAGELYRHQCAAHLTRRFIDGLRGIEVRGVYGDAMAGPGGGRVMD